MSSDKSNELSPLTKTLSACVFTSLVSLACLLHGSGLIAIPVDLNEKLNAHISASVGTNSEVKVKNMLNTCKIPNSDLITYVCYKAIMDIKTTEKHSASQ